MMNLALLGLLAVLSAASAAGVAHSNQFAVCGSGGCVSKPLALSYFAYEEECADLCSASEECSGYDVSGRSRFGLGSCKLYTGEITGEGSGTGLCFCKLGALGVGRVAACVMVTSCR